MMTQFKETLLILSKMYKPAIFPGRSVLLGRYSTSAIQNANNESQYNIVEPNKKAKTGILMLNMGGPKNANEVQDFLTRLFLDRDIIKLPVQKHLGPLIAKRRTPAVIKKYNEIGGGSPISQWTQKQGDLMCQKLDARSPETGPHKAYIGFRYAHPLTEDTLEQMEKDGVERVVAFSQYPQYRYLIFILILPLHGFYFSTACVIFIAIHLLIFYALYSCTTSGSSMTAIYQHYSHRSTQSNMKWSVIDRWPTNKNLVETFAQNIQNVLETFEESKRKDVVLLFSAHSIPQYVMDRRDPYPAEVGATVSNVMDELV